MMGEVGRVSPKPPKKIIFLRQADRACRTLNVGQAMSACPEKIVKADFGGFGETRPTFFATGRQGLSYVECGTGPVGLSGKNRKADFGGFGETRPTFFCDRPTGPVVR